MLWDEGGDGADADVGACLVGGVLASLVVLMLVGSVLGCTGSSSSCGARCELLCSCALPAAAAAAAVNPGSMPLLGGW